MVRSLPFIKRATNLNTFCRASSALPQCGLARHASVPGISARKFEDRQMKVRPNALAKGLFGTVAAGAMALSSVAPAFARDRNDGGISAGDVIAGAVIIGGIAAVASAVGNNNRDDDYAYSRAGYRDYDRDYRDGRSGWNRGGWGGNPRQAVEQCVRAAERGASRYSYGNADVTDIRSVRETRYGYEVRGRIAVNASGRDWRQGDRNYGRGWDNDYRGWDNNMRGYDSGRFTCTVQRGRVAHLDYSGIRGL